MADSTRHQIMDAVIAALEGITEVNGYETTVKTVSENLRHWEEMDFNEFPACFPIDADEIKEARTIGAMLGRLTVIVTCMVQAHDNVTRQARTDLIRDVEKAIVTNSTLAGLDLLTMPRRVVTDKGNIPNYSVWDQEFEIAYPYDRDTGG